jgi:hypothetical protein
MHHLILSSCYFFSHIPQNLSYKLQPLHESVTIKTGHEAVKIYRIYTNLMHTSIFKMKPKKYLLANVMCIGKMCTLYNNEFLLWIQCYKKTLFFDKLISSYTQTIKNTQLLNSVLQKTLFKFALESNAHPNFCNVIWPKKVRITFE